MNFNELLALYVRLKVLRPATIKSYESTVRRIHAKLGVKPIKQYCRDDWLDLRNSMLATCTAQSWNSLRRHIIALHNLAIEERLIVKSAISKVGAAPVAKVKPKVIEDADLLCHVERHITEGSLYRERNGHSRRITNVWFWAIYCRVSYFTGMRLSQITNLHWDDVKFERGVLRLRSEHSKTRLEWDVPITVELLDELRYLRQRVRAIAPGAAEGTQYVFQVSLFRTECKSRLMTQSDVKQFFQGYSIFTGTKISAHRIRHTTATLVVRSSGNVKAAQHLLGHADIKTTLGYVHPSIDDLRVLQRSLETRALVTNDCR